MITNKQKSNIIYDFVEYIRDDTGIQLSKNDIQLDCTENKITAILSKYEISNIEYEKEYFDESDCAIQLIETSGNIKQRLIEIKIAELEINLTKMIDNFKEYIKSQLLSKNKTEDLVIEVGEIGYDRKHWETDDEAETGYPIIGLLITDYNKIDFSFPLNIYYPEDSLDYKELKTEFENYMKNEKII